MLALIEGMGIMFTRFTAEQFNPGTVWIIHTPALLLRVPRVPTCAYKYVQTEFAK